MICTRSQIVTFLYRCMGSDTPDSIVITQQPVDPVGVTGDTVSVSVKAEGGEGALSYLWQYSYDGTTFYNAPLGTYFKNYDTDTMSFTIEPTDFVLYDGWYYRCVITDAAGNEVISDPTKVQSSLSAKLTADDTYLDDWDDSANVTVTVTGGTAPYEYRWSYKISGADHDWVTSDNWTDNPERVVYYGYGDSETLYCEVRDATGKIVTTNRVEIQSKKIV